MTVGAFDFERVALLTRRYEAGIEIMNQWRDISTTASFAVIVIYFIFWKRTCQRFDSIVIIMPMWRLLVSDDVTLLYTISFNRKRTSRGRRCAILPLAHRNLSAEVAMAGHRADTRVGFELAPICLCNC